MIPWLARHLGSRQIKRHIKGRQIKGQSLLIGDFVGSDTTPTRISQRRETAVAVHFRPVWHGRSAAFALRAVQPEQDAEHRLGPVRRLRLAGVLLIHGRCKLRKWPHAPGSAPVPGRDADGHAIAMQARTARKRIESGLWPVGRLEARPTFLFGALR